MISKEAFLEGMALAPILAIDTEANGNDIRDGRGFAMGVSVAYELSGMGIFSFYFPFRHLDDNLSKHDLSQLKEAIEAHPLVVFHNAKFDLVSLATLGINVTNRFYDTMLMAHMVNENWTSKALDWLGSTLLKEGKDGDAVKQWAKIWGWNTVPVAVMRPYACQDAALTLKLYHYLWERFNGEGLDSLWTVEQAFVRLLIKMESRGVRVNKALCRNQATLGRMRMAELEEEIGYSPSKPTDLKELFLEVLGLPVVKWTQLDPDTNEPTDSSRPSFDKGAMAIYDDLLTESGNETAALVLEYRGWQKAVSSNYEPYTALISPDGRLRPNYKIHGTLTGRLSCEKPNLQQIPRVGAKAWNGAMKEAFIPADGYVLLEADYSQLELRLGAAYANEEELKQAFLDGRDVFTEMSKAIDMVRQDVKTMVYTIQYGGGVRRLKNVFKITEEEAASRRDAYYDSYPGFKLVAKTAADKARRQGFLRLWTGRRRHFANPKAEAHKAFNSVIQGGAAEIVKHTMLRLERTVDCDDCRMLLQVHDSVVFEVKSDRVEYFSKRIKDCMEAVTPNFGVKFAVEVKEWSK